MVASVAAEGRGISGAEGRADPAVFDAEPEWVPDTTVSTAC